MAKTKRKKEDTELIAVITAAIAATREEGAPVPVITAVREAEIPVPAIEAAREEETQNPAESFVVRTIKRRDKQKNGRSPRL